MPKVVKNNKCPYCDSKAGVYSKIKARVFYNYAGEIIHKDDETEETETDSLWCINCNKLIATHHNQIFS